MSGRLALKDYQRILVIKLGALGDFVQALRAMAEIRRAHPKARITLLTTPPTRTWPWPAATSTPSTSAGGPRE